MKRIFDFFIKIIKSFFQIVFQKNIYGEYVDPVGMIFIVILISILILAVVLIFIFTPFVFVQYILR